jgi:predicted metal-dependent phosphoesterase TrpH
MQSYYPKNENILNADLHCHTKSSYDGYTSYDDLLKVCIKKNINVIAITEHDKVNKIELSLFKKNAIDVIYGCEYTTDCGAHIIGLFIDSPIKNASAIEVVKHIKKEGGLVVIPHPFKPGSGLCHIYKDSSDILELSDLIELYNGGYYGEEKEKQQIKEISDKYKIGLIASSDSHKKNDVGYYMTRFKGNDLYDLKSIILYGDRELYFDDNIRKKPRSINKLQKKLIYQKVVIKVPYSLRKMIKNIYYYFRGERLIKPQYCKIE